MTKTKKDFFLCKLHPDFHLPAEYEVGAGFDGSDYAEKMYKSGVDAVAVFAKCHYGHSYYPTEIGARHPRLKVDLLGDITKGCKEYGLGVIAYYSVFLDTVAVQQNPDWMLQSDISGVDAGFDSGNFLPLCVNSG